MSLTTDPADPRLGRGVDTAPVPQSEVYLVLPESDRARGFVRPLRNSYRHVGPAAAEHPLRDLTDEERERYAKFGYVKFEAYPESGLPVTGRYWTQPQLDGAGKGCGVVTRMGDAIAETYARQPTFYGSTYCVHCRKHLPVDEFTWEPDGSRVGS